MLCLYLGITVLCMYGGPCVYVHLLHVPATAIHSPDLLDCSVQSDCSLRCVYSLAVLIKCWKGCSPLATAKLKWGGCDGACHHQR